MKRTRKKRRKYFTFEAKPIETPHGVITLERCLETGEINFLTPSTIDGVKLEQIKEEYKDVIRRFRAGGQSEAH